MKRLDLPKINFYEPFLWVYFIWYYLPIVRTFFKSGTYNLIFFGILVGGCVICFAHALSNAKKMRVHYTPLIPVFLYFIVFAFLTILQIGTADRHIRVSFSFWGTLVVFYLSGFYPDMRQRLCKLMLVMFVTTMVTSIIGVLVNPEAARLITYAGNDLEEDILVRLLNIGGLAFFQGLAVSVPILMSFMQNNKYRTICMIMIIAIFIGLIGASFAISLIMFFVALLLGYLANKASGTKIAVAFCLLVFILIVPWERFLLLIAGYIDNERFYERIISLANSIGTGSAEGNFESRIELYGASLETFLRNPIGVGPEYTFINYQKGIGYHSQVLDDMARYGIFAVAFYGAFFVGYYRLLRNQWAKIDMQQIAWPVTLVYFAFLVLNPGFTSEHESVLILFLIPTLPEILERDKKGECFVRG